MLSPVREGNAPAEPVRVVGISYFGFSSAIACVSYFEISISSPSRQQIPHFDLPKIAQPNHQR